MADEDNQFAVLYVDSTEPSLRAFRLACQGQFRVLTASTTLEALRRLWEHKDEVGVIVAARCMPRSGGSALLRLMCMRQPQVVRLLASDGCSLLAEQNELGDGTAEGIIPIPWDRTELQRTLRNGLERFAGRASDHNVGVGHPDHQNSPDHCR
jgi:hypothetical protein